MDYSLFSPYVRYSLDSYVRPPYSLMNRMIFDYELLYIKEGEVRITIGDTVYKGVPKDLFFICPGEVHSIEFLSKPHVRQPHVHFDLFYQPNSPSIPVSLKSFDKFTSEERKLIRKNESSLLPIQLPTYMKLHNPAAFESILFEITKAFEQQLPYAELELKGLFLDLLVCLSREVLWSNNSERYCRNNLILEIRQYLAANTSSEITLDQLSSQFNINKYYLIKIFQDNNFDTPIHFHLNKRLELAKQLLQFTNYSITDIAEKTGFHSIHSFCRAFKRMESVSPKKYRDHGHL
ncbi:MAG: AraC family transcriptional regulator [Saccharofermentanales bacterium]